MKKLIRVTYHYCDNQLSPVGEMNKIVVFGTMAEVTKWVDRAIKPIGIKNIDVEPLEGK